MSQVYVLGGLRSYIGVKNGSYRHIPAQDLGAEVLKNVIHRFELEQIDCIIAGNSVGGGGNIARLMALTAGVPWSVPAVTVDLQCASALESISVAAARIRSKEADLIIAGGFESSSTQPLRITNKNHPCYQNEIPYSVAQFIPGVHREQVMLEGAELAAKEENITKEEMDLWVLRSHKRAVKAREEGVLEPILTPVFGLEKDEGIRDRMSQRLLDRLPPVLEGGSLINTANACLMNDGAAFVVLCSEEYLKKAGAEKNPVFRITGSALAGCDPMKSPLSAVLAVKKLLKRMGIREEAVDCLESNEAFALIDVLFQREYPWCADRYNRFGGALAYGHPYGASGAVIFLHLLRALEISGRKLGVCAVAAAGGIGSAVAVERI